MEKNLGKSLLSDEVYLDAKRKILSRVAEYSEKITGILPPSEKLVKSYEEALKILENLRGREIFYPHLGSGMGKGALVELEDGSVKYDFVNGIGNHFGHCHPKIIEACLDAAVQDSAMQGDLLQNTDTLELMEILTEASGLDHCLLTSSGSMANENALKIIFHNKFPANRILAFERGFLGRTLFLMQINDPPAFREKMPRTVSVDYLPFYNWKDPMGSTEAALLALRKLLTRHPKEYACCCFEMIQAEGSYPGKAEFFLSLIKILKEQNIAIYVNEVETFGMTDKLFAFQHFQIEEYVDVATVGKMMHTCATLFTKDYRPRPELFSKSCNLPTSSIRCAIATLQSLLNEGFLGKGGKNMGIRKHFIARLQDLSDRFPTKLEGPFGHGLMIACTPFGGDKDKVKRFALKLYQEGVISFIAGQNPTRLRFLVPSGGVQIEDIDQVADILQKVLEQTL